MTKWNVVSLFFAIPLCTNAFGQNPDPAQPGTLNYVEGQVSIGTNVLTSHSVGSTTVQPGQTLETRIGRAEVLLTPGVFVRVGANSAIRMVSPDLTHTEVALERGKADIEIDQIYKQNDILIDQGPTQTKLLKTGLYAFNIPKGTMRVFNGEAAVFAAGSDDQQKPVLVKASHKLALGTQLAKPQHFNKEGSQDGLYGWSSLRSEYLGAANENLATEYAGVDGVNAGWFWDPAFLGYTWLPGDGMFFSPFGYGFYSPFYLEGGGDFYNRGGFGRGGFRGGYGPGRGRLGGGRFGGVHPGGGMRGGGFHGGGGGGVHGGGGGGFHGGGGHR